MLSISGKRSFNLILRLSMFLYHLTCVYLNLQKTLQNTSAEIRRKIFLSNEEYKLVIDVHCRSKEFNVGDYVMVCHGLHSS